MRLLNLSSKRTFLNTLYKFQCRQSSSQNQIKQEIVFSNGRVLNLLHGKYCKISDGACIASAGDTNVLAAVVSKNKPGTEAFMPLTVSYREKCSAAGRIPTNHLRRELAPNEKEILSSRLIDRSIRPLFPAGFFGDTQISCNLFSVDSRYEPDVISINAASAALALSDIPWNGPVGAVRVALLGDEVITQPTRRELANSKFNMVVSSCENQNVLMIEAGSSEAITLPYVVKMIKCAQKENAKIIRGINSMVSKLNVKKRQVDFYTPSEEQLKRAYELSRDGILWVLDQHSMDKKCRDKALQAVRDNVMERMTVYFKDAQPSVLNEAFIITFKKMYADYVLEKDLRADGRKLDQIRLLDSEVNMYAPLHGCAMFQRGQTQVLSTVTFDSPGAALRLDNLGLTDEPKEKRFMLHYEFPKYATNEISRGPGSAGRREVGHGALAERAIRPLIPAEHDFTIRLTAEVLESNGSSSMASVCAGSMALMDAGVKLPEHVAGVAIGLLTAGNAGDPLSKYRVLTDISGFEDFYGQMDFKVAGTRKGFTALQLDCKLATGLNMQVLMDALTASHSAKAVLINHMKETINSPRDYKDNWPILEKIDIPPNKRSLLFGVNGLNIRRLKAETGVSLISDVQDVTKYTIFAPNKDAFEEANEIIQNLIKEDKEQELEFGGIYTAKVEEVRPGGVTVSLYPGMPPVFVRNKELDRRKVLHPSALGIEPGSQIQVKYFGRDPSTGTMRISRRVLQISQLETKDLIN